LIEKHWGVRRTWGIRTTNRVTPQIHQDIPAIVLEPPLSTLPSRRQFYSLEITKKLRIVFFNGKNDFAN
jgi:hypothetical protein